jgi:acetyl-CoA C-acetyltransferase
MPLDAYIIDALRTARGRGKASGGLATVTPIELACQPLRALKQRHAIPENAVEEVILGCVEAVGEQGGDIARIAALVSGLGEGVPGIQINRFCSSGLDAVNLAAAKVSSGQADLVIGGGVESMSRVRMGSTGSPWATDPQVATALNFIPQGISADLVATKYGFDRAACDAVAVRSQALAATAIAEKRFAKSLLPVFDRNGIELLSADEHPRPGGSVESLAKLRPAFSDLGEKYGFDAVAKLRYPEIERIEHVHHAGNSSGVVDGAAAVLIASKAAAEAHNLKPRGRIVSCASVGSDPCIMLTAPAQAARQAVERAGLQLSDIDVWEINEAFAAVVLRFCQELELDLEQVNVGGGAIALGHPLGATGAMILGMALDELERSNTRYAVIALCVGAGQGTATVIERLDS